MSEHAPDTALHGTVRDPSGATPPAQPSSLRRVTCLDLVRPDGPGGVLELRGVARDFAVEADGSAVVRGSAELRSTVDYHRGRTVTELETTPAVPELSSLVGQSAIAGFRGRVGAVEVPSLLASLLDDIPVGTLISGHAVAAAREDGDESVTAGTGYIPVGDQCAGYAEGGALITAIAVRGRAPVAEGPRSLPIDDAFGWAPSPLGAYSMRRRRRVDRWTADSRVHIDAMFRDSYWRQDGTETVIHEYGLRVSADEGTGEILESVATPRVLPWFDCPGAAASAGRLVGTTLDEVEARVRREFRGVRTCTHLNDLLRSVTFLTW